MGYTAPPAEGSGSAGSAAEPSVRVALLDGVSGASIYEHEQKGASGPVRLALTENTLVVQAQMLPSRAPLLSVIELYENATEPSILSMLLKGQRSGWDCAGGGAGGTGEAARPARPAWAGRCGGL